MKIAVIINMLFTTFISNIPKVLFHKTMAFVVKLYIFFPHAPLLLFLSRTPCVHIAPDTPLPDKIVSCHLKGNYHKSDVPDHVIFSVLCHYKHLCRICWASKVRIISSHATKSQPTATRSIRGFTNSKDCTLDADYGKEIAWS